MNDSRRRRPILLPCTRWRVAVTLVAILAVAAVAASAGAQPGAPVIEPATASARIDALFVPWNRPGSPGCSVGVRRSGVVVHERGYGLANLESGVPITPASVFHVASVSKQFTAASILLLAREGRLSLDDDVRRFLPEWQGPAGVTIRHLLTHTSGLRDVFLLIELAAAHDGSVSTQDRLVGLLARQRGLNTEPGSEYRYDNGGYVLLADIVRRVSGQSLRAYAAAHIFDPLGMAHTHVHDDASMIVPRLASGYSRDDRGFRVARAPDGVVGNAGLFTTSGDLLQWLANLIDGRVGGSGLVASMQAPTALSTGTTSPYGFGLMTGRHRGLRTVSHGGGDPGASAFALVYPDHAMAIAVLCNLDDIDAESLAREIGVTYLGDRMEAIPAEAAPTPAASVAPSRLQTYAGLYRDPSTEGLLRMFVRGDTLMGSSGAGADGGWPTRPLGHDRFAIPGSTITLEFLPSDRDRAARLRVVGERPTPFVLDRLIPLSIPMADLADYAGDYVAKELDTSYALSLKDGQLTVQIPGRSPITLQPIDRDGFAGPLVGVLRFARDAGGRLTGFTLHANGVRGLRFQRRPDSRG